MTHDTVSSALPPSKAGRPRASTAGESTGNLSTDGLSTALSSREQILDAAAALFSEVGFSGTSTRAIADSR